MFLAHNSSTQVSANAVLKCHGQSEQADKESTQGLDGEKGYHVYLHTLLLLRKGSLP